MSTNDNFTFTANTEAFFNVDIVDGDIVSINSNPRRSPVSYTDFPDIFKSSPSPPSPNDDDDNNNNNNKRIPPPPSQPPPLPPPSPSEHEYIEKQEPENHQHGPSRVVSSAADRDAASNIFHPIDETPFLLLKRHEEDHSAEAIIGAVHEQELRTSSSSSPPTLGMGDSTRATAGSSPKNVSPETKSPLDNNGPHTQTSSLGQPPSPSFSLREQVRSGGLSKRSDFPLLPSKVALLIIDVQEFCCSEPGPDRYYHHEALPRMLDNLAILLKSFRSLRDTPGVEPQHCQKKLYREQSLEVIFSIIQSQTKDGRDLSLDYKLSGPAFTNLPTVHMPLQDLFPPQVQPNLDLGKGDIVVSKTSCSVFQSTNLDYMLRNLNIEQLVVAGQFTEQCIESAVRDAADLGYFVTVVHDACAAQSLARQTRGLEGMAGFCRIRSTAQVVDELEQQSTHPWQPSLQLSSSSSPLQPLQATTVPPHRSEHKSRRYDHNDYYPHRQSPSPPDPNHEIVFNQAFLRSLQHGSVSFLRYLSIDILHNLQCHVVPIDYLVQAGTLRYPVSSLTAHTNSGRRSGGGGEVRSNDSNDDEEGAMLLEIEPDLSTLQFLPHVPNTATLLGALCSTHEGNRDVSPYCVRSQLATILQKAKETDGIHFSVHAEIQFALHNATTGDPVDKYSWSSSSINRLSAQGAFIGALDGRLRSQQIKVDAIHAGSAPGQLFVALGCQSPLELADAVVMTQVTIRSVALEHSLKALFLPHIHSGGRLPGNGLSLFLSFDEMMNIDEPSMLSSTGGSFVQGMLEHLSSLVGVTLPTNNSFRRLLHGVSVGTRIGWGRKSKDAALLLVGKTPYSKDLQLEYRLCDNTCNIHLALAALLVAGMDGVSRTLVLQNALDCSEGAYTEEPLLPQSLSEAIDNLANDTRLVQTIAPSVSAAFLAFRREEAHRTQTMSLEDEIQEALENA